MKSNVGTVDKAIRFVIGAVIIIIGYYFNSWWGLLGLLPLATATFGFCLAYLPFGINTHKAKAKK